MNKQKDSVLFVDDEEINLFLFEKRFENDFNVITAESGMEALEKLEAFSEKIKVVISDMRMPNMDGLEFVKTARKRFKHVRYFILTGYSSNVELEEALENQLINKLFKKPFDYEVIREAVTI